MTTCPYGHIRNMCNVVNEVRCIRPVTEALTDRTLLKIARRIHEDQLDLGLQLNIDYAEIQQVKRSHAEFVEATLNILMVSADVQIIENLQDLMVSFGRN